MLVLNLFFKRLFDIIFSSLLLLALAPFLCIIAFLISLDSSGPVIFKQKRLGFHLIPFTILKFRSMYLNSESTGTHLFSYKNDSRVTKIGYYLRILSLDELPQLFNIIKGDMSFVGPRPPVTYELGPVETYTFEMKIRFNAKPGVTGLAQVLGRNHNCWDEKIRLDNLYVKKFSRYGIFFDLYIAVLTFFSIFNTNSTVEIPNSTPGPIGLRAQKYSSNPSDSI